MSPIELFGTIYGFRYTISANFLLLSIVLAAKKNSFQQNKRIPNKP